nr:hypothetical protein BaRGS_002327 [Batillaria attramentaria]
MIIILTGLDAFATDGNIEARGGYFGITNMASKEVKDQQINDLIDRMMEVVRNNDYEHYNCAPLDGINQRIEELLQERLQQNPDKTKEQAQEDLKQEVIQGIP